MQQVLTQSMTDEGSSVAQNAAALSLGRPRRQCVFELGSS
jgi:hypothetical protein